MNTARYDGADELLAKASAAVDPAARKAAYKAILQKVMTDVPVIPLYTLTGCSSRMRTQLRASCRTPSSPSTPIQCR